MSRVSKKDFKKGNREKSRDIAPLAGVRVRESLSSHLRRNNKKYKPKLVGFLQADLDQKLSE